MSVKEDRARAAARRRFEARELLERLKAPPCEDCGNDKLLPCQKDLWRRSGETVSVSRRMLMSQDRIRSEAAKCVLLCANCARLRTWRQQCARRAGPT